MKMSKTNHNGLMSDVNVARKITNTASYGVLIFFSALVLFPILWIVSTSLKNEEDLFALPLHIIPAHPTLHAFKQVWIDHPFLAYFKNSLIVVSIATFISVIFSAFAAYGISRFQFRGRGAFMAFLLGSQLFPSIMLLIPYYKIYMRFGLINTHAALIITYVSFSIPFCTWMMRGYFAGISKDLDLAAQIDGAGRFRIFRSVILPLSWPGLAATTIYSFISGWNEYIFALVLTQDEEMKTVPVGIGQLVGEYRIDWAQLMAASLYALIPLSIIFIFFNRYFVSGLSAGAVKE
jgi:ABC-type glycerol-3-phosphate transport system permease component